MNKILLLGPPGAGKGTQAVQMKERLQVPHISTGDMLRSAIARQTELGMQAKSYIDAGDLVPDELVIAIVKDRLAEADCANGYLLDGFPRTVAQAEALDQFAQLDMVLLIDANSEQLVKRISGRRVCPGCGSTFHVSRLQGQNVCPTCGRELIQREDDQEETVRNRLEVYAVKTQPLISYYQARGLLKSVNGDQSVEQVFSDICSLLEG